MKTIEKRYNEWLEKAIELAKEMNLEIEFNYEYDSGSCWDSAAFAVVDVYSTDTKECFERKGATYINE